MELTEFITARLAEDEAVARAAVRNGDSEQWEVRAQQVRPVDSKTVVAAPIWRGGLGPAADHIARHDPARVLAEVEAHRLLVDAYTHRAEGDNVRPVLYIVLQVLASIWRAHPDFDPAWEV